MRESKIEKYLKTEIEKVHGKAFKFTSPGNNGVPDRIVLLNGEVRFVELKAPGKELRPIQKLRKRQFEKMGFNVRVIDSLEGVDDLVDELKEEIRGSKKV